MFATIIARGAAAALLACAWTCAGAAAAPPEPAPASSPVLGRVTDAATGEPLPNANVQVRSGAAGTIAGFDGLFTLRGAPAAPFVLVVTHIGYEPALRRVDPAALAPGEQLRIALQPTVYAGEEVVITASRYGWDVHLSLANLPAAEIQRRRSEADIPVLLEDLPGVHAASDAGNGVGYTYLNIRGFDQRRVGVMINGIPLNDPEDHQVYWVDMPDLLSSLEDIQVQRGITNSLGGMTAIGGTVNLITDVLSVEPQGRLALRAGSHGTATQSLTYQTGLRGGRFASLLRVSHLESDGYRQRSGSDQWGVFWSGRYLTPKASLQANIYTGRELTHQAWYGVDEETLARDRTHNPETYLNAVDDFRQPHYELHHRWNLSDRVLLKHAAYLIHGEGFYENFRAGRRAADFSLDRFLGVAPDAEIDLIRRKLVRKDQIGWVPQLMVEHRGGRLVAGGDWYTFHSNHWGEVIAAAGFTPEQLGSGLKYYDHTGDKNAWSAYMNEQVAVGGGVTLLLDLQLQHKSYEFRQNEHGNFRGEDRHAYRVAYDWFSPKGGAHWRLPGRPLDGELGLYAHVGVARREPADADLFDTWTGPDDLGAAPLFRSRRVILKEDGVTVDRVEWSDPLVKEERVVNYELGAAWRGRALSVTVNGYWMDFRNEIVPYGGVDDEGYGIKGNAGKTLHRGLEAGLTARLGDRHQLTAAASRSWDRFESFLLTDWDGSQSDLSGNPIPLFPSHLATVALRSDWGGWDSTLRLRAAGRQHLDGTGRRERTTDPYAVLDAGLGVALGRLGWEALAGARVEARIRNLLDAEYETSGYYDAWGAGNYKIPAAKRNILLGVEYVF